MGDCTVSYNAVRCGMATNRGRQTSVDFSDELRARINDFCEASSKMTLATFLREAAEMYMDERLENEPRVERRYDDIRQKRLAGERTNIRVLDGGSNDD